MSGHTERETNAQQTGRKGRQQNCTRLPPNTGQTSRLSESTSLYYISWPAGNAIAESKQNPLGEVATLLCFGASVLEQLLTNVRTAESLSIFHKRLICSDFTSTLHSNALNVNVNVKKTIKQETLNPKRKKKDKTSKGKNKTGDIRK